LVWSIYILKCKDGTYYTGIAKDLERRIAEHNGVGTAGAKYTRSRRPVTLSYYEMALTRSEALIRENKIKRLSRKNKEQLILGK
jgi:putative endonuclease